MQGKGKQLRVKSEEEFRSPRHDRYAATLLRSRRDRQIVDVRGEKKS